MKHTTLLASGIVVLGALATTVWLAKATVWQLTTFSIIIAAAGLLGLITTLAAVMVLRRGRTGPSLVRHRIGIGLLVVGAFMFLQLAYFAVAPTLRRYEIRQAQAFIDTLVPELEAYHSLHNSYPPNEVPPLAAGAHVPRLLALNGSFPVTYDNSQFYFRQGDTYRFSFYVPDGFIGFHYGYCCGAAGKWTVTD